MFRLLETKHGSMGVWAFQGRDPTPSIFTYGSSRRRQGNPETEALCREEQVADALNRVLQDRTARY
jgi:hypothetical protein